MSIEKIITVCERRWALPALCALADGAPVRAYPLAKYMGAGRTGLHKALQHLAALGYVERVKGYGHPLRPELVLTRTGQVMAQMAKPYGESLKINPVSRGKPLGKWALPTLMIAQTPVRFNDLGRQLGRVSDRALALNLSDLEGKSLLAYRCNTKIRPIIGRYQTTVLGQHIVERFADI